LLEPCDTLVLGGFRTKYGAVSAAKCATDFPDQSELGGLPKKQVLQYVEKYAANSGCTGARIDAADAKRRMCHNNTFFNPDYDPETGEGATNGPCPPNEGGSFIGGIDPADAAEIEAALLEDDRWKVHPTLNLSCSNSGNIPTTLLNSENFAASSFQLSDDSSIVAFVMGKSGEGLESPATSASPTFQKGLAVGLRVTFDRCNSDGTGLDQVICKHIVASGTPNDKTVDLTIRGDRTDGLGFLGNALKVKINNARKCEDIIKNLF
jgi:hypothetical protein